MDKMKFYSITISVVGRIRYATKPVVTFTMPTYGLDQDSAVSRAMDMIKYEWLNADFLGDYPIFTLEEIQEIS
jgi:hypothetical protein